MLLLNLIPCCRSHVCFLGAQNQGLTALHWAATKGYAELAKLLLERGAKVDTPAVGAGSGPWSAAPGGAVREVYGVGRSSASKPNSGSCHETMIFGTKAWRGHRRL